MKKTELYSFESTDIEHVRKQVEDLFHVKFEPHDSYHYGNYYHFRKTGIEDDSFRLRQNIIFEGELQYPELPGNVVLLDVVSHFPSEDLRRGIANLGAKLVRSRQEM